MTAFKKAVISIRLMEKNNGSARHVISQGKSLCQLGYEVTILSENVSEALLRQIPARWVRIFGWPLRGYLRRWFYNFQIQRWLAANSHDLFISNSEADSDDILVMHNCVNLTYERIENKSLPLSNNLGRVHRRVFQNSRYRLLITVSNMMKDDLVGRYKLNPETVAVSYPGVDLSVFNTENSYEKRTAGREMAGLSQDAVCAGLIASGDFKVRNVRFFLYFAKELLAAVGHEVKFLIVGENRNNIDEYIQLCNELEIKENVIFLPFVDNVRVLYHALDLFVYPAYMDTFGYVVLESLASGLPCLVSDNVGASEIMMKHSLPHVLSGYVLENWVEAAVSVLRNKAHREQLAAECVSTAANYSLANQTLELKSLFAEIV